MLTSVRGGASLPIHGPADWTFALDRLTEMAAAVTAEVIMTPERELYCVNADATTEHAQRIAEPESGDGPFDQLPVRDGTGHIVGLLVVGDIKTQPPETLISKSYRQLDACSILDSEASVPLTLKALRTVPACFVGRDREIIGLVHASDVSKHVAKSYFYLWLSALEAGLASLVERRVPDLEWISALKDHSQVQVLGNMEFDTRHGLNLNPIEYLYLPDLLDLISKKRLMEGVMSPQDWAESTRGLAMLRNHVMHPVRSLVTTRHPIGELFDIDARIRDLVKTLRSLLTAEARTSPP